MQLAVREQEECIRDVLDRVSGEKGARNRKDCGGEVADDDSFVDIMAGVTADRNAESECWIFADALALARAYLSVVVLAESVIDTSQWPTC